MLAAFGVRVVRLSSPRLVFALDTFEGMPTTDKHDAHKVGISAMHR